MNDVSFEKQTQRSFQRGQQYVFLFVQAAVLKRNLFFYFGLWYPLQQAIHLCLTFFLPLKSILDLRCTLYFLQLSSTVISFIQRMFSNSSKYVRKTTTSAPVRISRTQTTFTSHSCFYWRLFWGVNSKRLPSLQQGCKRRQYCNNNSNRKTRTKGLWKFFCCMQCGLKKNHVSIAEFLVVSIPVLNWVFWAERDKVGTALWSVRVVPPPADLPPLGWPAL